MDMDSTFAQFGNVSIFRKMTGSLPLSQMMYKQLEETYREAEDLD